MAMVSKQLGQVDIAAGATAEALYSPGASTETIIAQINVCNYGAAAIKYRIYNDDDGTTRTTATALYYDINLGAYSTDTLKVHIALNDSNGEIAVESDIATVCFTCWGAEVT